MLTLEAPSPARQEGIGEALSAAVTAPCTIYLRGDLGAGKTTLVRGFLRARGHGGAVKSPTYTLMEAYELAAGVCYHLDLYRLVDPEELEYLGIRDLLGRQPVVFVEWPERGAGGLPSPDLDIRIAYRPQGRSLEFQACSPTGASTLDRLAKIIREYSRKIT